MLHDMFASLKQRNFQLYFGGQCVSLTGTWIQQIAMSWLVYRLTGSVLLLATVAFMAQIPSLVVTPFFSVFVDRFNRRNILVFTQSIAMLQALLLAFLVLTGRIQVWQIIGLSTLVGLINALDTPTRQAFYTSLVPPKDLSNAIALNSAVINGARLIGPAIGGVLIDLVGEGYCFLLNGLSYIGVITALLMMNLAPFQPGKQIPHMFRELKEGFYYTYHNIPIRSLLILMAMISFFGLPLTVFIPAYVKDTLNGDSQLLGLLLSSIGVGSFCAAIYLALRKTVLGLGKVISLCGIVLGCSLIAISFTHTAWFAALICLPIGFTLITSVASINTLLQTLSDEDKRGRVMGYLTMAFTGICPVGSMLLGSLEKYTGLAVMILVCGLCCIVASIVFEHFRPYIHAHARKTYVQKGIIKEIALGLDSPETRQF